MADILFQGTFAGRPEGSDLTVTGLEVMATDTGWLVLSETGRGSTLWETQIGLSGATLTTQGAATLGGSGQVLLDQDHADSPALFVRDPGSGLLRLRADAVAGSAFNGIVNSQGFNITQARMLDDSAMPLVLVARAGLDTLSVLRLGSDGTFSTVSAAPVPAFEGHAVTDLAVAQIGGQQVAVAISAEASTIASFTISSTGSLNLVETLGMINGLGINTPIDITAAEVEGRHFMLVASYGTSSLSVLEVTANGGLTLRDQINDNLVTRFGQTLQVETLDVAGRQMVAVAGTDGGITVFELHETGILIERATYDGNAGTAAIAHLELAADGGHLHLFAASDDAGDIRHFSLDLTGQGVTLVANDQNMNGTAADDTLILEGGRSNIYGGAGADLFIIKDGVERADIRDYNRFEDQIDLSFWPRVYSLDALQFSSLSYGVRISQGNTNLILRSHDGVSLDRDDFATDDLFRLWRIPSDEQQGDNSELPESDLPLVQGGAGSDTMFGGSRDEFLKGLGGNDMLEGRAGHDVLSGDAGQDMLVGGSGWDTFLFLGTANGGDVIADYETGQFDLEQGRITGDVVLFEATSLPVASVSGPDLVVGGVQLTGAASDNLMFAYTALQSDSSAWNAGLQEGGNPFGAALTMTLQDFGTNEAFRVMTGLFSDSGALNRIVVDNDNNSRSDYRYDPDDLEAWTQRVFVYSTDRALLSRVDQMDDGSRFEVNYDPLGTRTWTEYSVLLDSAGNEAEYNVHYDTGIHQRRLTDTWNTEPAWHQIEEYRNGAGTLYDKRTTYDSGEMMRILTDVDSLYTWSTLIEDRNAAGIVTEKLFNYDTGRSTRDILDIENTQSWDRITEKRNVADQLESKLTAFDDGAEQYIAFDATSANDWTEIVEERNAQGAILEKEVSYDSGLRHQNLYDVTDAQAWTRLLRIYDSQDRLTERVTYDDNGSRLTEIYDVENIRTWSRTDEYRNTLGQLTERFYLFDTGPSERTLYDTGSASWRTIVEDFDSAGQMTEQTTLYDDNSQIRFVFDQDDTSSWHQIEERRDATGALYDKRTDYDDGTQIRLIYDTDNASTWDMIDERRTATGDVYDKRTEYDDGSQTRLILDTEQVESWDQIQEVRDATEALTKKTVFYDDGRYQITLYDTADVESWDSYARLFASDDTLLSETFS